jgi:predicted acetyltransferase
VESSAWDLFKEHHYLTSKGSKAFSHYLFTWNNKPVGIVVVSPLPSAHLKNAFRGSRTVILPDFQGLGIGAVASDFIGAIYRNAGRRYYTKTIHPALGEYRNSSDSWRGTPDNGKIRKQRKALSNYDSHWQSKRRASYCHEYIGESLDGYEDLLKPIKEMRESKKIN